MLCAYCRAPAIWDAHVDADGIGWMANCCNDKCDYLAKCDAERQRDARQKVGTKVNTVEGGPEGSW